MADLFAKHTGDEDIVLLTESAAPRVLSLGIVHWRGLWTLSLREVERFLKIPLQTIFSPLLMTVLFFAVFSVSLGAQATRPNGVSFLTFLVPGLVIIAMAQSAFFNTASSLILSKILGTLADVLMAPLSALERTIGYALGGIMRGLAVGAVTLAVMSFLHPLIMIHPLHVFFFGLAGVSMLSLLGLVTGLLGDRFDHLGTVQNFLIMPATFLSGSFFSFHDLPATWRPLATFNPFFYMIDGFRYGFTDRTEAPLFVGAVVLLSVNLALAVFAYLLFSRSSRIRP